MIEGVLIKVDNVLRDYNDKFIDTYYEFFDGLLSRDQHRDFTEEEVDITEDKVELFEMSDEQVRFYAKVLMALKGDPEVIVDEEVGDTTLDYNFPIEQLFFNQDDRQRFLNSCGHTIFGNSEVVNQGVAELVRLTNSYLVPVYFLDDVKWDKSVVTTLSFLIKAQVDFKGLMFYSSLEEKKQIESMFKWHYTEENAKVIAKEFTKDIESDELFIYLRTIELSVKEKLKNGTV